MPPRLNDKPDSGRARTPGSEGKDSMKYYWPKGNAELVVNQRFVYQRDVAKEPDPCVLVELTEAEASEQGPLLLAAGCTTDADE